MPSLYFTLLQRTPPDDAVLRSTQEDQCRGTSYIKFICDMNMCGSQKRSQGSGSRPISRFVSIFNDISHSSPTNSPTNSYIFFTFAHSCLRACALLLLRSQSQSFSVCFSFFQFSHGSFTFSSHTLADSFFSPLEKGFSCRNKTQTQVRTHTVFIFETQQEQKKKELF